MMPWEKDQRLRREIHNIIPGAVLVQGVVIEKEVARVKGAQFCWWREKRAHMTQEVPLN